MTPEFMKKYPALIASGVVMLCTWPFANLRIMRPGGDEKVYVSQALEMLGRGDWFVQTLAQEPNYYKGPLHYLFLIFGTRLFGLQNIATVYMNFLLVGLAVVVLVKFYQKVQGDADHSIWLGVTFGLCAGVLPFTFSSQMEAELIALYAIAIPALFYSRQSHKAEWLFWLVAGIAGLTKSPLHAVLLGLGGYLYWAATGSLIQRLTTWRSLLPLAGGITACCAGFLPAFLYDMDNFLNTYVVRETLSKSANRHSWYRALVPVFSYNLFPWILPSLAALGLGIWRFGKLNSTTKSLLLTVLCLAAPTAVFFAIHPYRSSVYCVPLMGPLLVGVTLCLQASLEHHRQLFRYLFGASVMVFAIALAVLLALIWQLNPSHDWWPTGLLPAAVALTAVGTVLYFLLLRQQNISLTKVSLGLVPFYLVLMAVSAVLGEAEMRDARHEISLRTADDPSQEFGFYNLHRHTWNEWGYLNYWLGHEIKGIHTEDQAVALLENGGVLMIPGSNHKAAAVDFVEMHFPLHEPKLTTWRRWRSKADGFNGNQLLRQALRQGSFAVFEQNYYFLELENTPAVIRTSMRD